MATTLKLSGIIPPMITPLLEDESLDIEGVDKVVEHMVSAGMNGIFVLGTNGEGTSCPLSLKIQLIERTCSTVNHRVPVLVGVTDNCMQASLDLAKSARSFGADAVVLAPPGYLPINSLQLESYVDRFCQESPLPVILYNIPICTRNSFDFDLFRRCQKIPNVIGIKESSGNLDLAAKLASEFCEVTNFCVLIGTESNLVDALLAGVDGGICAGGNIVPDLYAQIYQSTVRGDHTRARKLLEKTKHIEAIFDVGPSSPTNMIQGIKAAMEIRGLIQRYTLPPIEPLEPELCEKVRAALLLLSKN